MPSSSVPKVEHILPEIGTTSQHDGRYPALLNSALVIAPAQTQINFVFMYLPNNYLNQTPDQSQDLATKCHCIKESLSLKGKSPDWATAVTSLSALFGFRTRFSLAGFGRRIETFVIKQSRATPLPRVLLGLVSRP